MCLLLVHVLGNHADCYSSAGKLPRPRFIAFSLSMHCLLRPQVPLISKFQKAHMEQASPCLEALSVQGFLMLPVSWHPEVSRTAITSLKVLVIPGLRQAKAKLPDSGPFDFVHFWDQNFTMLQIAPSLPSHLQIPSRRQAQGPFSMYQACSKLLLHASLPCGFGLAKTPVLGRC